MDDDSTSIRANSSLADLIGVWQKVDSDLNGVYKAFDPLDELVTRRKGYCNLNVKDVHGAEHAAVLYHSEDIDNFVADLELTEDVLAMVASCKETLTLADKALTAWAKEAGYYEACEAIEQLHGLLTTVTADILFFVCRSRDEANLKFDFLTDHLLAFVTSEHLRDVMLTTAGKVREDKLPFPCPDDGEIAYSARMLWRGRPRADLLQSHDAAAAAMH